MGAQSKLGDPQIDVSQKIPTFPFIHIEIRIWFTIDILEVIHKNAVNLILLIGPNTLRIINAFDSGTLPPNF